MNLEIRNICKTFQTEKGGPVPALEDITLSVREKEFVALVGPSGCGKSTLLNITAGLLRPDSGEVVFTGTEGREPVSSIVFQETGLLPWRNVRDNIAFGLEAAGMPEEEQREIIDHYTSLVGLKGFEKAYPHQLSGGMRQRVGIARALAVNPSLLLMDEPFSALDAQTRTIMQEELVALWEKSPLTILYVTHNIEEAVQLADRVVLLTRRPGKIREILTIPIPRPERNRPEHGAEMASLVQRIWEHIRSDARAALMEVETDE